MHVQQQANRNKITIFILKDKRNVKNITINIKDGKTENLRHQFVYFVPYVCSGSKSGAIL